MYEHVLVYIYCPPCSYSCVIHCKGTLENNPRSLATPYLFYSIYILKYLKVPRNSLPFLLNLYSKIFGGPWQFPAFLYSIYILKYLGVPGNSLPFFTLFIFWNIWGSLATPCLPLLYLYSEITFPSWCSRGQSGPRRSQLQIYTSDHGISPYVKPDSSKYTHQTREFHPM